jgi:hypothetical protein
LSDDDSLSEDIELEEVSLDLSDESTDILSDDVSLSGEEPVSMDDFLSLDTSVPQDDVLSMDDLDIPSSDDDLNIEIDEQNDTEELKKLRDEGAKPVTFAPDNSSYLEDEELNPDSFDLSDAVIDEPEMLSHDNISDNLIEPSLENEFDMDSLDDLTIDEPKLSEEEILPPSTEETDIEIPEDDAFAIDDLNDSFETDTFDIDEPIIEPVPEPALKAEPAPVAPKPVVKEAPKPEPKPVVKEAPKPEPKPVAETPKPEPVAEAPKPAIKEAPALKAEPAIPKPAVKEPVTPPKFAAQGGGKTGFELPSELKTELRSILSYMDQLLESLPEEKIEEFAKSEYFASYRKLFKDLGLV